MDICGEVSTPLRNQKRQAQEQACSTVDRRRHRETGEHAYREEEKPRGRINIHMQIPRRERGGKEEARGEKKKSLARIHGVAKCLEHISRLQFVYNLWIRKILDSKN
jgi:hypothetical protein